MWSFCTEFVSERATHAHAPTTASPRMRTGSLCVKHGCAFQERIMLNCVAEFRQKRKSWHDWLIISQLWDTITTKPVRCGLDVQNAVIYSGRHCCCVSKLLQYNMMCLKRFEGLLSLSFACMFCSRYRRFPVSFWRVAVTSVFYVTLSGGGLK